MRVLVLGSSGMLGHVAYQTFFNTEGVECFGTVRSEHIRKRFNSELAANLISDIDITNTDKAEEVIKKIKPDVVVNCIGVIKQHSKSNTNAGMVLINSWVPHQISGLGKKYGYKTIHISTDCVFNGSKGGYVESDVSDATDYYGKSKYLGELVGVPECLTLRTSIIGPELETCVSLLDWFLAEEGDVNGYTNAIFSGLTTYQLSRFLVKVVKDHMDLEGLYQISNAPISKYDLLKIVADKFGKNVTIHKDDSLKIDRSLNSEKIQSLTGFQPESWDKLVSELAKFHSMSGKQI